jgi:hypothetical protein
MNTPPRFSQILSALSFPGLPFPGLPFKRNRGQQHQCSSHETSSVDFADRTTVLCSPWRRHADLLV